MKLERVTSQPISHNTQPQQEIAGDNLKGITLPTTTITPEHLMFCLNNILNGRVQPNIYSVNCRTEAGKINKEITPRELTAGCGGG